MLAARVEQKNGTYVHNIQTDIQSSLHPIGVAMFGINSDRRSQLRLAERLGMKPDRSFRGPMPRGRKDQAHDKDSQMRTLTPLEKAVVYTTRNCCKTDRVRHSALR
jgi:hypothetical protein